MFTTGTYKDGRPKYAGRTKQRRTKAEMEALIDGNVDAALGKLKGQKMTARDIYRKGFAHGWRSRIEDSRNLKKQIA